VDNTAGMGGPHIAAAFLCEKVLHEKDGVASVIRIVDRFHVRSNKPEMPPARLRFTAFVSFKAGDLATGKYEIKLQPQKPDGTYLPAKGYPIFFEGSPDRGVNIEAKMELPVEEEGLYWIDVLFAGSVMTRIPLRVLHQQNQTLQPGSR